MARNKRDAYRKEKRGDKKRQSFEQSAPQAEVTEKIRVDSAIKRRENKYYRSLSERYRVAGFTLFLLFVVFCGVMMIRYNEYITYDNFVYLVRDFDSMDSSSDDASDEIVIDIDASAATRPFRGGFAVAERDRVTLYDSTGVVLLSESESFSYPALAVSDKYIIAYDIGGNTYSVYNAATRVVSRKTEFPIVCASVCGNGAFLVTTESDEAKYVTEIYNTALSNTMNIYKDKYVVSASVSADGEWVMMASLAENGADFACEVAFYRIGENVARKAVLYNMALPLATAGLDGGNFVLVSDDAVRFFTPSGELLSETVFGGEGIACFDTEAWGAVLVLRENSIGTKNRVYVFDKEGSIIYDKTLEERVSSVYLASEGNADALCFAVNGQSITSLGKSGEMTYHAGEDVLRMIDTASASYAYTAGKAVSLGALGSNGN